MAGRGRSPPFGLVILQTSPCRFFGPELDSGVVPPLRVIVTIELHDSAKNTICYERSWPDGPALVFAPLVDANRPLMRGRFTLGSRMLSLPIQTATWDTESDGWAVEVHYPSGGAPPHILDAALKSFEDDSRWSRIRFGAW